MTSKTRTILAVLLHLVSIGFTQQSMPGAIFSDSTFVVRSGMAGLGDRGLALCNTNDGNLYVAASSRDSGYILKMTPAGVVLWAHAFDYAPGYDNIVDMKVDSEGMLYGCGSSATTAGVFGTSSFSFRFNPMTRNFLWLQGVNFNTSFMAGIHERAPGGNYCIAFRSAYFNGGAVVRELDRNTGQEMPGQGGTYTILNMPAEVDVRSSKLVDSTLFTLGYVNYFKSGNGVQGLRPVITSIDLGTNTVNWSSAFHIPFNQPSTFFAEDIALDSGYLVLAYSGAELDTPGTGAKPHDVFLQKLSINGNIVWIKKFDFQDMFRPRAVEVIPVHNGYVLLGEVNQPTGSEGIFILKSDKEGALIWAKKFQFSLRDDLPLFPVEQQIVELDSNLFFTGFTIDVDSSIDVLMVKLDSNGDLDDSCKYIVPTPVVVTDVFNPAITPVGIEYSDLLWEQWEARTAIIATPSSFGSTTEYLCGTPPLPDDNSSPCDVKTNGCVQFDVLDVTPDAHGDRTYRIRFSNRCAGQVLDFLAIQLPKGTVALDPANSASFISTTGRNYVVRNPNYSPFYSIRFRSQGAGLSEGESDIFVFKLKSNTQPAYFNVLSRLSPGPSYEAHLNVFNCDGAGFRAGSVQSNQAESVRIFPNPTAGNLAIQLPDSLFDGGVWQVADATGRKMLAGVWRESTGFDLPTAGLAPGMYFLQLRTNEHAQMKVVRFVKQE